LVLAEHTASWSLLTKLEMEIAHEAVDVRFEVSLTRHASIDQRSMADFFVRLYLRAYYEWTVSRAWTLPS
jgi:hypothetical protein